MSSTSAEFLNKPQETVVPNLRVDAPSTVVIFGATGDLTSRKLIPALFNLHLQGYLPEMLTILGVARRDLGDDRFREMMTEELVRRVEQARQNPQAVQDFVQRIFYHALEFNEEADFQSLARRIDELEARRGQTGQRLFYMSTAPTFFSLILGKLDEAGLIRPCSQECGSRVVIEKPFGEDLESARQLNREVMAVLDEDQIYRIDHYLGKETVQNILSFRFGNAIFETLFNNKYVDHVQITVAEAIGMEGRRGGYYDQSGALRDVVQNHGLQLLCLVAMEPPAVFDSKGIRDEKVKVLQSLAPLTVESVPRRVVRGQYVGGMIDGQPVKAYRDEEGVAAGSVTETYLALRMQLENWRWAGVPFLLRTGKNLPQRVTEIAVQFKQPPLHFFTTVECVGDVCDISRAKPNVLVFRIQPDEGISLTFSAKQPGMQFRIHPVQMDFLYNRSFQQVLPEAYERLLLDVLRSDSTLFTRSDEVDYAWRYVDPILKAWSQSPPPPLHFYEAGTWGPHEADHLLDDCQGKWRQPS